MPEEFHIDTARQIIWTRVWGELNDETIRGHQERLRADPAFAPSLKQLVDTTAVTRVNLTMNFMVSFGRSKLFNPEAKRAYVVNRDVVYGFVRMYSLYQEIRGHAAVNVFRNRPDALAWLGVTEDADEIATVAGDDRDRPPGDG